MSANFAKYAGISKRPAQAAVSVQMQKKKGEAGYFPECARRRP